MKKDSKNESPAMQIQHAGLHFFLMPSCIHNVAHRNLEKKGLNLSDEIVKFIDGLYNKHVPSQVREFLELTRSSQNEFTPKQNTKPKARSSANRNNQS